MKSMNSHTTARLFAYILGPRTEQNDPESSRMGDGDARSHSNTTFSLSLQGSPLRLSLSRRRAERSRAGGEGGPTPVGNEWGAMGADGVEGKGRVVTATLRCPLRVLLLVLSPHACISSVFFICKACPPCPPCQPCQPVSTLQFLENHINSRKMIPLFYCITYCNSYVVKACI